MKYLLLVAVLLLFAGLAFLAMRWPQDFSKTFSHHAAAQKASSIYFFLLFSVVIPLLVLFFYGYFIPAYHLGLIFSVAIGIAIAGQFVAAVVPEADGRKSQVHRTVTGWSAFGLFVAVITVMVELPLPLYGYIFGGVTIAVMLFCSMLAFRDFLRRRPFQHRYFLWLQIIYYAMFFGFVGAVTYLK